MRFSNAVLSFSVGLSMLSITSTFAVNSDKNNVGATQSGPGASGLFTPNSPGNNAALSAQMHGGLAGSPIVNGTGSNLRVTVPFATPSSTPNYEQFTSGGVTGVNKSTVLNDPPAAPSAPPQSIISQRQIPDAMQSTPAPRKLKSSARAASLGRVNGSINYGDGEKVMFGSGGVESIHKHRNSILQLNDGRTLRP